MPNYDEITLDKFDLKIPPGCPFFMKVTRVLEHDWAQKLLDKWIFAPCAHYQDMKTWPDEDDWPWFLQNPVPDFIVSGERKMLVAITANGWWALKAGMKMPDDGGYSLMIDWDMLRYGKKWLEWYKASSSLVHVKRRKKE